MKVLFLCAVVCAARLSLSEAAVVPDKVALATQPFDLRDVRLLDGEFKTAQETDRAWLMRIDADRMLHNFRVTAGLPSTAKPYGGWEEPKCELRGHTMGHYLTACAMMYAATGDAKLKERVDYMVAELAKCQAAMPGKGFGKGFLSGYPEELFDRVDAAKKVWAPYYTLHKIYAGLLDAQEYCGNAQALEILRGMTDWLDARFGQMSHEAQQQALHNEHGGMAESLAEVYARTGEPRYLRLAEAFRHDAVFDPAARGEDKLTGLHANTQFPKFIGYERIYELTGDETWHAAAKNFWTFVARDRSFVIGGNSTHEGFFGLDKWEDQMKTLIGPESCNTYNMLKLTARLSHAEPTSAFADFYERALFNHIRSHQHPGDGNFVYYTSLRPGSYRNYSGDDTFFCCVGTGMENPARYAEAIYSRGLGRIYIDQFIASEVKWRDANATLKQETTFPGEPRSTITLKLASPQTFTVAIRKPCWITGDFGVSVNGKASKATPSANGYLELNRQWNNADKIEIELPMRFTAEFLPRSSNFVSFLYGPVVLAGKLGRDGMSDADFHGQMIAQEKVLPFSAMPVLIAGGADDLLKKIEPVPGRSLEFVMKGVLKSADVTLVPFGNLHDERYAVYWPIFADEASWQNYVAKSDPMREIRDRLAKESIDFIIPGDTDSERLHKIHADKSGRGEFNGRLWRDANGGWFSYELKVQPGRSNTLVVTYWGSDGGGREFDIIVNGKIIATQKLGKSRPEEFFDVEYPLPAELIAAKDHFALKFQAHPDRIAGGVFGIRVQTGD